MNLYHDKNACQKFTLGRKEKENRVCELLKKGKTVREIAAIEHLNFSQIKRIRDKYFDDDDDSGRPSKRSQALKLILEGKSNVDIAMELDLSAKETLEFRQEYLILKDDDDLLELYRTVGRDKSSFLTLYREMKIEDLSAEEAVWALTDNRTFKKMSLEYDSLIKKVRPLSDQVESLRKENLELEDKKLELTEAIEDLQYNKESLSEKNHPFLSTLASRRRVRKVRRIMRKMGQGIFDPTEPATFP
jgi:DNA-binding CsgD family transcriptional regulator